MIQKNKKFSCSQIDITMTKTDPDKSLSISKIVVFSMIIFKSPSV